MPIPPQVLDIVDLGRDHAELPAVIRIVDACTTLSRTVLREANSLTRSSIEVVSSIEAAVTRLGMTRTVVAALGSALEAGIDDQGMKRGQLWRHSVASAHVASVVGAQNQQGLSPLLPVAALLHDIGVPMMRQHAGRRVGTRRQLVEGSVQDERKTTGIDHAEVGARMISHWGLPDEISEAIRFHHAPFSSTSLLAHAVCVSSEVSDHILFAGLSQPPKLSDYSDQFFDSLDLLDIEVSALERAATDSLVEHGILGR